MAGAIRSIFGEIKFRDGATSAVNKLRHSMDEAKQAALSMNDVLELGGMAMGAAAIKEFVQGSIEAFATMETQSLRLKHLSGEDYPELKKAVEEAAEASKGLVDESDMATAANQALKYGASLEFVKDNLSSIQKFGQIVGEDTGGMMQQLTMYANTGNARMLKSLPLFNKHLDQLKAMSSLTGDAGRKAREQAITNILQQEQNKLNEQYNEELQTTNAMLKKIKAQWDEIKELMGGAIIKQWGPILELVGLIEEHFNKLNIPVKDFSIVMEYLAIPVTYAFKSFKFLLLVIEDIMVYFRGGKSVFGDWSKFVKDSVHGAIKPFVDFKNSVVQTFYEILEYIKNIPSRIVEFFRTLPDRLKAELIEIKNQLKNIFSGDDINALSFIKNAIPIIPGKAGGGDVNAGKQYLVGEHGPELFMPKSQGSIIPNDILDNIINKNNIKSIALDAFFGDVITQNIIETKMPNYNLNEIITPEITEPEIQKNSGNNNRKYPSGSNENINTVTIQSLVGSMVFNVSGPAEAAQAVKESVMDTLNELSRTVFRAELGMGNS